MNSSNYNKLGNYARDLPSTRAMGRTYGVGEYGVPIVYSNPYGSSTRENYTKDVFTCSNRRCSEINGLTRGFGLYDSTCKNNN